MRYLKRKHSCRAKWNVTCVACVQIQSCLSSALSIYLTCTHKQTVWVSLSAVRQTEGRTDECSQVARAQSVVCTVISTQVFKESDVH